MTERTETRSRGEILGAREGTGGPARDGAGERAARAETESGSERFARIFGGLGPFFRGNRVDVLRNGVEIFPAMLAAITAARESIELLTFVYWEGAIARRFAEALAERARAGVCTRVLLDGVGAMAMPRELLGTMRDAGVDVRWFREPVRWKVWESNNRTHRKVLVCDSAVGFTGGVGIAEEWEGDARDPSEWRDTHFRVRGPAVRALQAAFWDNWLETGDSVEPLVERARLLEPAGAADLLVVRATASVGWSDVTTVHHLLIAGARERLHITTAYFVPDDESVRLLRAAARRGVEVTVLAPGPHTDHRVCLYGGEAVYEELLSAGVEIRHYLPTMLHVKCLTVDGAVAAVGSANFNHRSLSEDDEIVVLVLHDATVAELDRHFAADVAASEPFDLDRWKRRSRTQRAREWLGRSVRWHI